jgi:hypothetical protein
MNVLIVGTETAGIVSTIKSGMLINGHQVLLAGRNPAPQFYETPFDINPDSLTEDERRQTFGELVAWGDLVIYVNASGFFVDSEYDYEYVKSNKKQLCVYCTGSDTRIYSTHIKLLNKLGIDCSESGLDRRARSDPLAINFLRLAGKYADIIISTPDQSYHSEREYYVGYQPFNIDTTGRKFCDPSARRLLHIPSTEIKGTSHFLTAASGAILGQRKRIECGIGKNYTHQQFLKKLCETDIYLDELFFFNHGMASVEAMCTGVVSVAGDRLDICPHPEREIWPANTHNLKERLSMLLEMSDLEFNQLSDKVRRLTRQRHDHVKVCRDMVNLIHTGSSPGYTLAKDGLSSLVA